jgi:hypothetical protein
MGGMRLGRENFQRPRRSGEQPSFQKIPRQGLRPPGRRRNGTTVRLPALRAAPTLPKTDSRPALEFCQIPMITLDLVGRVSAFQA